LNRGRHLYSAGRPSRWALAHILVKIVPPVFAQLTLLPTPKGRNPVLFQNFMLLSGSQTPLEVPPYRGSVCTLHLIRGSLDSPDYSASQIVSRSFQQFLHNSRQTLPVLYNGPPFPLQNWPFTLGNFSPI